MSDIEKVHNQIIDRHCQDTTYEPESSEPQYWWDLPSFRELKRTEGQKRTNETYMVISCIYDAKEKARSVKASMPVHIGIITVLESFSLHWYNNSKELDKYYEEYDELQTRLEREAEQRKIERDRLATGGIV